MKKALLILSCLLMLNSCDLFKKRIEIQFDLATFNSNRAKWQALNISNYYYIAEYPEKLLYNTTNFTNVISNLLVVYSTDTQYAKTIDETFQFVEDIYYREKYDNENYRNQNYINAILVEYDPQYYFITRAKFDVDFNTPTFDSDIFFNLIDFESNY